MIMGITARASPLSIPKKSDYSENIFSDPRYIITVDTEEEFDWDKPFTRDQHGLTHYPKIDRFQNLCVKHGIKPIYLVDYPIVQNDEVVELLRGYCDKNIANIGIQLHPWVNPPFDEDVTCYNSYACNLPPDLERAKLTNLCELIAKRFNINPSIYRAGRYGAGANTVNILNDLDVKIDTSVRSRFSYTKQHGPNYSKYPVNPYWITPNKLLELPVTTVFTGLFSKSSTSLYHGIFESKFARSFMARSGLVERIALTPEGVPLEKAMKAIEKSLEEGVQILNFSFHSPSLAPGYTPYVRNEEDLEAFYCWWEEVFSCLAQHEVAATSLDELLTSYF